MPIARLTAFATSVLEAVGVTREDAETTTTRLIEGDQRGQRAHGLARLPAYVRRIEAGGMDPRGRPHVVRETDVTALIDGQNGLGPVIMTRAIDVAANKAQSAGIAWIGVRGSNHAGAGGVYAQILVDHGLIAIIGAVANINQMAPWGGVDRLLGPNPIAIGLPAGQEAPLILDMASSTVSFGRVRQAIASGQDLPAGWLIDSLGQSVTDPAKVGEATLAPIGGYKGYGLSLMLASLAGTLNGAAAGSDVVDHYSDLTTPTNTGHFVLALSTGTFRPLEEFKRDLDQRILEIRTSRPMPENDRVRVPGEQSHESLRRSKELGVVALSDPVLEELRILADRFATSDQLA